MQRLPMLDEWPDLRRQEHVVVAADGRVKYAEGVDDPLDSNSRSSAAEGCETVGIGAGLPCE